MYCNNKVINSLFRITYDVPVMFEGYSISAHKKCLCEVFKNFLLGSLDSIKITRRNLINFNIDNAFYKGTMETEI